MPRVKGIMKTNPPRKGSTRRCKTEANKVIANMMKENKIKSTGGDDPWMTEDEFRRRTEKREVKEKLAFVSKKKATSKELYALIEKRKKIKY